MRVLKENNQEYRHKCKYCKSIYAYKRTDINFSFYEYIKCPVCKELDTVSIFDRKVKQCKIKK